MKFFGSVMAFLDTGGTRHQPNIRVLVKYLVALMITVVIYAVIFQLIMAYEGQAGKHSWFTGLYWALTVMSTLGFGDITFQSDLGRVFSMVVLLSGMVGLLILMPFLFIEFFYVPFLNAQAKARAPRKLPEKTSGHVILTNDDQVTLSLIDLLDSYEYEYVLVIEDPEEAVTLVESGYKVVVGKLDDPETATLIRTEKAALVVATRNDIINTNIAFTVRQMAPDVRIVTTARDRDAIDILNLAGSSRVLRLGQMLGNSLARRTISGDARAHVIGEFDELVIAEATAAGTPLVGKTLAESKLRQSAGINVVGVWERGNFAPAAPETEIQDTTVLVLAGSIDQVRKYDALFCIYHVSSGPVVIIGSGRVGRSTAESLIQRGIEYRIVDEIPERLRDPERSIPGNATDRAVLDRAGIQEAPAVIITTRDDEINIYLTIYCRKLRPDIQIISRATTQQSVSVMHRAGADFVMSYANMGASAIFNYLERGDILMLAEGLNVFRIKMPAKLAGKTLRDTNVRKRTGCHVIAISEKGKPMNINPDPGEELSGDAELVLIGSMEDERKFLERYGHG